MELNLEKSRTRSQQFRIDRKMIGILSVFAVLGVCLVITIVIATNTLSALRAFGSMQTHWTEARKASSFHLVHFLETENQRYVAKFDSSMHLIRISTTMQQELLKEETDKHLVRQNLLDIRMSPNDLDKMITTFEWFHEFGDFSKAVTLWDESDRLIYEMEELAYDAQNQLTTGSFTPDERERSIARILNIDQKLTDNQYEIAGALASGTQLLNIVIIWVSTSLGFILLLIGGILSFRFLKSFKNWQLAIEISEQKFRSLFEQNPNAVCSLTKDGRFVNGNKALEQLTGYSIEKLKGKKFNHLVSKEELERVWNLFEKAAQGEPQTYEALATQKNGEVFFTKITNLPIYVDGKIVGVFGIASNITERKKAEQKIKEQLEDKTHLLSEVHDRVKNNLALMSSLIQLEREFNNEKGGKYLDSTVSRIHSMAMVHEQLYHTETFSSIRMDKYVKKLSETIKSISDFNSGSYELVVKADPVTLSIKKAIPTGLILNELVNNAFNYAFVNRKKGRVEVELSQEGKQVFLKVSDNGVGLPQNFDLENPKTMGMKLVTILSKQLGASLHLENKGGTIFTVKFSTQQGLYMSA